MSLGLPLPIQLLRIAILTLLLLLLAYFLSVGTMESRVTYVVSFLICFINPVWGIYAIALMGPLFLLDQSKTHLLAGLEVFAIGMMAGELRLLRHGVVEVDAFGQTDDSPTAPRRVHWGLWPYFLGGLFVLLLASSLTGIQLLLFKEYPEGRSTGRLFDLPAGMFYRAATVPEWTLKCLWNWGTGMIVAMIVARRANPLVVARWLKLGGLSLLVACAFGLLEWLGLISLSQIRGTNPDPLQTGRLQGTAGHPGWFGQWIVMMWTGLLLWWSTGRNRRNAAVTLALALVGITLVLTAARAAWLSVLVAAAVGSLYALSTFPAARRKLLIAAAAAVLVVAVGIILGGDVLANRLIHFLRTDDRANYYVTGLLFLREHPFGIGLGTHFLFYDWLITPYYYWAQMDHVDSHSLWLHTLIENGPFVPIMLLAGVIGIAAEVRKAWRLFDPHSRTILVAVALGFLGLIVIGTAQYLPYIRVIELCAWISAGAIVGLCRKRRCRVDEPVESWSGRRILLLCGCLALVTGSMNASRVYPGNMPRSFDRGPDGVLQFWTGSEWRTPVNADIDLIAFNLYRTALPVSGEIIWPDGRVENFELKPEQRRAFEYHQAPGPNRWYDKPSFLVIRAHPLWTPAETIPGNNDSRPLGVYVSEFRMDSEQRRAKNVPALKY